MILCTSQQREEKIFDWVQTFLNIEYPAHLQIISVEPSVNGFEIIYRQYFDGQPHQDSLTLYNSQIILFESFRK